MRVAQCCPKCGRAGQGGSRVSQEVVLGVQVTLRRLTCGACGFTWKTVEIPLDPVKGYRAEWHRVAEMVRSSRAARGAPRASSTAKDRLAREAADRDDESADQG